MSQLDLVLLYFNRNATTYGISQNQGSQLEPINQNSQVSDSSQIHRMTLKYSDDEITDEGLRGINLKTAAHQYMMESEAQQKITPIPFQKTPSLLDQCHEVNTISQLPISNQLNFWMEHQGLGYKSPT